jgi:hypothetical protein
MDAKTLVDLIATPVGLVVSFVIVIWSISLSYFIWWCVKAPNWTADEGFRTNLEPSSEGKQSINAHYLGEDTGSTPLDTSGDHNE